MLAPALCCRSRNATAEGVHNCAWPPHFAGLGVVAGDTRRWPSAVLQAAPRLAWKGVLHFLNEHPLLEQSADISSFLSFLLISATRATLMAPSLAGEPCRFANLSAASSLYRDFRSVRQIEFSLSFLRDR